MAQFLFNIIVNLPLYILVVLLYPAASFPPSLTANPEICRLTGADMVLYKVLYSAVVERIVNKMTMMMKNLLCFFFFFLSPV